MNTPLGSESETPAPSQFFDPAAPHWRASGYFQTARGPRRQWQHRRENQEARDARRMRLLELVGGSLLFRAAGHYRGGSAGLGEFGGSRGPSQAELAERLSGEGHPCSQATVSRDLQWLLEWSWPERRGANSGRPLSPLEQVAGAPCRTPRERDRQFDERNQAAAALRAVGV